MSDLAYVEQDELKAMGMQAVQIQRIRQVVPGSAEAAVDHTPAPTLATEASAPLASSTPGKSQVHLGAGISRPVSPTTRGSTQPVAKPLVMSGSE